MRSCLCNPSIRRQRASSAPCTRPPRPHARPSPASRLPSCAQNFLPNLTHSLINSRVTPVHLACLSTPPSTPKMLLTSIPFATATLPANHTTLSWPSRLPLPNPQYAIQRPTCSFPLARAWTTVYAVPISRKTKATADHLCTLTNVYCLTEQPQLQDHTAPAPDATRCAHPQTFFRREQGNT